MTMKSKAKTQARGLQLRTGWSYSECLRCTRTMTSDQIEALIAIRGGADETEAIKEHDANLAAKNAKEGTRL